MSDANNSPEVAHRVEFDLVPIWLIERVFEAAIAVAWASDGDAYAADSQDSKDILDNLRSVISKASRYTIPVNRETGEPL